MNYSKLLNQAFEITKKYKFLWLLSFLTILGGVAGEESFGGGGGGSSFRFPSESLQNMDGDIQQFFDGVISALPIIIAVLIVFAIIAICLFIVGLIAKGGQIDSIIKIDEKKKTTLGSSFGIGKKFAWRIFLVRLLFGIGLLVSLIVVIPLFILLILFFFITIPILWVFYTAVGIVLKNAQILIVAKNYGVFKSVKESYKLLIKNWKDVLVLWLIQLGLGIVISLTIIFCTIIIAVILGILIAILIGALGGFALWILAIIIPLVLVIIVIMLFLSSIAHTFFTSYWTLGINSLLTK